MATLNVRMEVSRSKDECDASLFNDLNLPRREQMTVFFSAENGERKLPSQLIIISNDNSEFSRIREEQNAIAR